MVFYAKNPANYVQGWINSKKLRPFFFIYSLKYYSGTPSYGHLGNTVTSSLRPLFIGRLAKTTILFLVKKPSFIRSPRYYATIFLPIGDRINELPLDYQSETTSRLVQKLN